MKKLTTISLIILITLASEILTACIGTGNPHPTATTGPTLTPTPTQEITPSPSPSPSPTPEPPFEIRLVWFYKPPADDNLLQLAQRFGFFILTKGDEEERDQLIALGARRPILQYLRSEVIQDPGSCTRQPWRNQVAYLPGDFCRISEEHPDWFLLDQKGRRIVNPYGGEDFVMMDPGNPGWRAFFLERVRQSQADPAWDGVFLDNVEVTMSFREQRDEIPALYPDLASFQAANLSFLAYLRNGYFQPENKLLYANLVARGDESYWDDFLAYLDGAMIEGWVLDWRNGYRSVKTWETQLRLAEEVQNASKFIILISQGTRDNEDLQSFALASFLLVNQGRAVFRYANSSVYREVWLYENYALDLGQPLGPRYRDGDAWRRDFSNGSVMVNPDTHDVEIIVDGKKVNK